jgi:DNA-binding beta-propeller fold protein YncE
MLVRGRNCIIWCAGGNNHFTAGGFWRRSSPSVTVLSPLVNGLRAPVKIALDADGNIYVADQRVRGVVKYSAYGEQLAVIRTATPPSGLAIAQDGSLLVSQGDAVVRYSVASGLETSRFTEGKLQSAASIAVDDVTGYVYVVDSRASQIVSFTASGAIVIGSGQLTTPTELRLIKFLACWLLRIHTVMFSF